MIIDIKEGWEVKKLGEVCNFQNGFAFKSNTYKETGLPILRITNIQNQNLETSDLVYFDTKDYKEDFERFKVFKGDLVVAMSGATTGKLGINNSDTIFYLNQRVGKFIPTRSITKTFLYYFLSTKVQESLRIAAGAAQPNLSTEQINNFAIPLPSLPEQQRIVSILDEAFAVIAQAKANAEQNLKNAKELFESYLQGVFENNNENWNEKKLVELCYSKRVITYGVIKLGNDIPDGIPCLRTSNVRWLNIDTRGIKKITTKLSSEYSRTILQGGEVLVNVRGTLGGIAVATDDMRGWNVSREVAVVPIDSTKANPSFIAYLIGSIASQKWLSGVKKGAAYVGINIEDLRLLPVTLPRLDVQLEIVNKIASVQNDILNVQLIYQKKIADLDELKKSLLEKAFKGELTDKLVEV